MDKAEYDRRFRSKFGDWRKRRGQKCCLVRMIGMRRCEIEFEDGVRAEVNVLAIDPAPLEATAKYLRSLSGGGNDGQG